MAADDGVPYKQQDISEWIDPLWQEWGPGSISGGRKPVVPILGLAHHTGGPAVSGRAGTEKEFYWPLLQRETRREVGPGLRNKGVAMVTHEETHSSRRGKGVECRPPSQDRDKAGCHGDAHSFPCMPGLSPGLLKPIILHASHPDKSLRL